MPPADGATGYPIETAVDTLNARRWPDAGSSRIPNWVYTDAGIFAREQERIFEGSGWLYACLEAEIARPGDFKRSRLGTKEVVAARDASGEVQVLTQHVEQQGVGLDRQFVGAAVNLECNEFFFHCPISASAYSA